MSLAQPSNRARSVRRRLTVYSLVSAALMLVISAVGLTGINHQRQHTDRLNTAVNPLADANQQLVNHLLDAQSAARAIGLLVPQGSPPALTGSHRLRYVDAAKEARAGLTALDRMLGEPELTEDPVLRTRLLTLHGRQRVAVGDWLELIDRYVDQVPARAYPLAAGEQLFTVLSTANADFQRGIDAERTALQGSVRVGASRTSQAVLVATVAVLVLVLMVAWRTTVSLTTPLLRLRDTVRKQRQGDRLAWARTDVGAAEVRDLAGDVNALTNAHLQLVDQQASSLVLQRAGGIIARRTQDAPDLATALLVFSVGLGRAIGADRVLCATLDRRGHFAGGVDWCPSGPRGGTDVPIDWHDEVLRYAAWLWREDRDLHVPDLTQGVTGRPLGWSEPLQLLEGAERGSVLIVPIGSGERAIGLLVVQTDQQREFGDVETAFVHQSAAEVARVIVKSEIDSDRAEYVRRLEELDRHKDDFLSTVSHELRTPLTSIHGYLEMLEDGDAGPLVLKQLEMLAIVGRNAARLKVLIEDLLVLNRMDTTPAPAGSGDLVAMADLVAHTVEELRPLADQAKVTLSVQGQAVCDVRGDRPQLARALVNVVSNAIKFTPSPGAVRVRYELVGEYVRLECSDDGIGIPAREQEGIFVRFSRGTNATAAQIQGTGLGLAIVKNIVERHGGRVELQSEENVGTTLRILLPSASYSTADGRADGRPGVPGAAA